MPEFNPDEFSKFKASQGPEFNQDDFNKFKDQMSGPKSATLPRTMGDYLGEFIGGAKQGFKGMEQPPQSLPERFGQMVGKEGPAVAGMTALGLGTGGMGLIPAAGMMGLGAAGGEAYRQIGAKMLGAGEEHPIGRMGKQALTAIATELGLRFVGKGAQMVADMTPEFAQSFLKMPAESVKWVMKRFKSNPDILPVGGPEAKAAIEKKAVYALSKTQEALMDARKAAGDKVGEALESLHESTKGKDVFDLSSMAQNARKLMTDTYQAADSTIKELASKDIGRLDSILKSIEEVPRKSAKAVNRIKQELQKLSDFTHRGLPEIQSDLGQQVIRQMGKDVRQIIQDTASGLKNTALQKANQEAKTVYDAYDELRPVLGTNRTDVYTLLRKVGSIAADFNSGGLRQEILTILAKAHPQLSGPVNELLDSIAARAFTQHAPFSPSSWMAALMRSVVTPKNLGRTIKAAQSPITGASTGGAKMLTRAGTIMAAPLSDLPLENLSQMLNPALGPDDKNAIPIHF